MGATRIVSFRIPDEFLAGMEIVRDRQGVPFSEQIRRGLVLFLKEQGLPVKRQRPADTRARLRHALELLDSALDRARLREGLNPRSRALDLVKLPKELEPPLAGKRLAALTREELRGLTRMCLEVNWDWETYGKLWLYLSERQRRGT